MNQSNIRAERSAGSRSVGNETFVLQSQEEINTLHNLTTCFIETNQKVTSSGSFIMPSEIRDAKDLLARLEAATDGRVDLHENEVTFMQGKV